MNDMNRIEEERSFEDKQVYGLDLDGQYTLEKSKYEGITGEEETVRYRIKDGDQTVASITSEKDEDSFEYFSSGNIDIAEEIDNYSVTGSVVDPVELVWQEILDVSDMVQDEDSTEARNNQIEYSEELDRLPV